MLLIHGDIVTLNETNDILQDGAIWVKDGQIQKVGKSLDLMREYPEEKQVDCSRMILMPGFVNPHYHGALSITRGVGSDLGVPPLYSRYVPQGVLLSEEECYQFSLLGYVEALRAGSTCIGANYIYMDSQVQALADLGVRAVISERIHDINFFKIGEGIYERDQEAGETSLARNIFLMESWHKKENNRITCHFGPHAPDTCSTPFLEEIVKLAKSYNVGITTHLAQSTLEMKEIQRREGISPVRLYHEIGMLGSKTVAAHCIHVSEEDIELLAKTKTHVAHVPEGNIKKGDIAPIYQLEKAGVNVAICTDAMSGSMPEAMGFALAVHRLSSGKRNSPDPEHVVRMATVHGAKALGLHQEIGSLEAGKKADIIAIRQDRYHLTPVISPFGMLVHAATGTDVSHVWIDGEWRVKDGHVIGIDEERLCVETQKLARACWDRYKR